MALGRFPYLAVSLTYSLMPFSESFSILSYLFSFPSPSSMLYLHPISNSPSMPPHPPILKYIASTSLQEGSRPASLMVSHTLQLPHSPTHLTVSLLLLSFFVSSAVWAPPVHSQREAANTTSRQILSWAHRLHNSVVSPSCWDPPASCVLTWSCSHKMKKTVLLKLTM